MEYDLRSPFTECKIKTLLQTHITDDRSESQIREGLFKLQAQIMHRGFSIVIQHKFADPE